MMLLPLIWVMVTSSSLPVPPSSLAVNGTCAGHPDVVSTVKAVADYVIPFVSFAAAATDE